MEGGLDRQEPPVLKQERDRLVDRKNVLESNVNRITKEFQSLMEELFHEEKKVLKAFEFDLVMDKYLGWVHDKQKGFRSKSGRSQDLRQWLNSTKARKWADSLFGDMLESCQQYAWQVGQTLESKSDGIECLTNYLQCEYFIVMLTGTIGSGSGSGSRPLICDHSFHKRKSKMLGILNDGIQFQNANRRNRHSKAKSPKHKKEGGSKAKKYFVELYKKQSNRYFAKFIMFKTQQRKKDVTSPLVSTSSSFKKEEMKPEKEMENESVKVNMKSEMEVDSIDYHDDDTDVQSKKRDEDEPEELESELEMDKEEMEQDEEDEDENEEEEERDEESSSDEPLLKIGKSAFVKSTMNNEMQNEVEKSNGKLTSKSNLSLQRLNQENKEMKETMTQMENKIRQVTKYRDSETLSLRGQLNSANERYNDAENKNIDYENRLKSINEEMELSRHTQQMLTTQLDMVRMQLEMLHAQKWNSNPAMMNPNGYNGNMPMNWMPALQLPSLNQSNSMIPSMSPSTSSMMFSGSGEPTQNDPNLQPPSLMNNGDAIANRNQFMPLLNSNGLRSNAPMNMSGGGNGVGVDSSVNNSDGMFELDPINDFGLKRMNSGLGRQFSDWNHNVSDDFNFSNSTFYSSGNMDIDMDII